MKSACVKSCETKRLRRDWGSFAAELSSSFCLPLSQLAGVRSGARIGSTKTLRT